MQGLPTLVLNWSVRTCQRWHTSQAMPHERASGKEPMVTPPTLPVAREGPDTCGEQRVQQRETQTGRRRSWKEQGLGSDHKCSAATVWPRPHLALHPWLDCSPPLRPSHHLGHGQGGGSEEGRVFTPRACSAQAERRGIQRRRGVGLGGQWRAPCNCRMMLRASQSQRSPKQALPNCAPPSSTAAAAGCAIVAMRGYRVRRIGARR